MIGRTLLTTGLFVAATLVQADTYERIAVAGGDLTEIVYALGAGDKVVAADSTSNYPASVQEKAQIGYVRALSAEGVLSISPDLLIGADDAGPANVIENLKAAGLPVAIAPLGVGADRVPTKIRFVGETLGLQEKAEALISEYQIKMDALEKRVAGLSHRPKVLFILSVRDGAPVVGGRETSANDIIELAGGQNVAVAFESWKPMNAEAIIASNPDVILMSGAHTESIGGDNAVMNRPDIQLTNAGRAGALVKMDGMLLLGFGPRTAEAVETLMGHLHGEGS
jgi:iron complex transport system substrate-binding protein